MKHRELRIIYISGKISYAPKDGESKESTRLNKKIAIIKARRYFSSQENLLRELHSGEDVQIINPFQIKPFLGIQTWLCYMIADLIELRKCTDIVMLNGWLFSRGAVIEWFFGVFIFKLNVYKLNK